MCDLLHTRFAGARRDLDIVRDEHPILVNCIGDPHLPSPGRRRVYWGFLEVFMRAPAETPLFSPEPRPARHMTDFEAPRAATSEVSVPNQSVAAGT